MHLKNIGASFVLVVALTAVAVTQTPQKFQTAHSRIMPSDFISDGCSLFPDGNYRDCCVEHDKDYYFGGSGAERKASDKRLYKCVKATRGWQNKFAAPIIWLGVRTFGVSYLRTPFRWGFGIKKPKKAYK